MWRFLQNLLCIFCIKKVLDQNSGNLFSIVYPYLSWLVHVRVVALWRESLAKKNAKAAQSLADPAEYENLFPGLKEAYRTEQFLAGSKPVPAKLFPSLPVRPSYDRTIC